MRERPTWGSIVGVLFVWLVGGSVGALVTFLVGRTLAGWLGL